MRVGILMQTRTENTATSACHLNGPVCLWQNFFFVLEDYVSTYVCYTETVWVAGGNARFHNNSHKNHLFYFCFIEVNLADGCISNE